MSAAADQADLPSAASLPLAPWLQAQLQALLQQRGHAWLLAGPSGLGQFELALALARAWLCEQPSGEGACGHCSSCHGVDVHTHADLCVLMPETMCLALGWPLDEKAQDDIDNKKRKPSKEIRVEAARQAVSFSQVTRSRGHTKVVLVFPAEAMNTITANTLLKTLEEPPGALRFILATEAAQQLLPTLRSRCQSHSMLWPNAEQAVPWLASQGTKAASNEADWRLLLAAAGGRPADALAWSQASGLQEAAERWRALPLAVAQADARAIEGWTHTQVLDALQKLCHDAWAMQVGAAPRFFSAEALTFQKQAKTSVAASARAHAALAAWTKELALAARTVQHPYNPGLMLEALLQRASGVLREIGWR